MKDLLRCFEIYGQIICFFAHETVALSLQEALSDYRCYISDLSDTYTFQSVRHFHNVFVYSRIQLCQDDAHAWRSPNKHLENQILRTKPVAAQSGAHTPYNTRPNAQPAAYRGGAPTSSQPNTQFSTMLYCNRYNGGTPCNPLRCRYSHTCNTCGGAHPAMACTTSSSNTVPLGTRPPPGPPVTRP